MDVRENCKLESIAHKLTKRFYLILFVLCFDELTTSRKRLAPNGTFRHESVASALARTVVIIQRYLKYEHKVLRSKIHLIVRCHG